MVVRRSFIRGNWNPLPNRYDKTFLFSIVSVARLLIPGGGATVVQTNWLMDVGYSCVYYRVISGETCVYYRIISG